MTAPDSYDFNSVATVFGKTKDGKPVGSNADGAYTKFMALEAEKKVNAHFATNPDDPVSVAADEALNFFYEVCEYRLRADGQPEGHRYRLRGR